MSKSNIENLISGYKEQAIKLKNNHEYQNLVKYGQDPKTLIVSCCDSRVDPALLFKCGFGEIFVLRNIANIVPKYNKNSNCTTAAALQFSLTKLEIENIIILGHSCCAGIAALCELGHKEPQNNVESWLAQIRNEKQLPLHKYPEHIKNDIDKKALNSALQSRENLLSYPWVTTAIKQRNLKLHAWFIDIEAMQLYEYEAETNEFRVFS